MSANVASLITRLRARLPRWGRPAKTEPYLTDWKHYYHILRINPEADAATITAAYRRLIRVYRVLLSLKSQQTEFFQQRIAETEEAYDVLSDGIRRAAYNRILKSGGMAGPPSGNAEMDQLVTLMVKQMAKGKARQWVWPRWVKAASRAAAVTALVVVLVTAGGTSLALARPQSTLAAPFRGVAVTITGTAAGAIGLIEEVRGVVAEFERAVVSQSVQAMRVMESVRVVPVVVIPTNDMAVFPSPAHCLFPEYVDRRYSQFKYTVDSRGIVQVDTSGATTDALLSKIKDLLSRLDAE